MPMPTVPSGWDSARFEQECKNQFRPKLWRDISDAHPDWPPKTVGDFAEKLLAGPLPRKYRRFAERIRQVVRLRWFPGALRAWIETALERQARVSANCRNPKKAPDTRVAVEAYHAAYQEANNMRARVAGLPAVPEPCADPVMGLQSLLAWCDDLERRAETKAPREPATGGQDAERAKAADAAQDERAPEGVWSTPMSKTEMATRLGNLSPDKFKTFAEFHGIRQAGNRQLWHIRLDKMDMATRHRIEHGRPLSDKPA